MALTEHYYTQFEEGKFYHIYNRSVDKKLMFRKEGNYDFFLKRYEDYLSEVVDTYAYCLLGNHFHLLVQVKDLTRFRAEFKIAEKKSTHNIVSHQFRKFFQSYAMAFNKQHQRTGTLFQTPFKRALVDSERYFTEMIYYIHANPQKHELIDDFREWKWSSYCAFLEEEQVSLAKKEVLDWFGGKAKFEKYHLKKHLSGISELLFLEED